MIVWCISFTGTQSELQWQLKESIPCSRNTKSEITFYALFPCSCVGLSNRLVSWQFISNLRPHSLLLWSVGISVTDFCCNLSAPTLPCIWQDSSKPCHTSLCNDISITSLCASKLASNRAELPIRWSKHSLLTLGSLTQEMCDLSCWVV